MAETTIKAPRVSGAVSRSQARNRNRTDGLSLTTRALLPPQPCGRKVMVGQGLEPRPFGLQPSALPVKLTNQIYVRGEI